MDSSQPAPGKVSFYLARRVGNVGGNTGLPVTLTANGSTIFPFTAPNDDANWYSYTSSTFVASQSNYTFEFQTYPSSGGSDETTLLDDVHLVFVSSRNRYLVA